MRTVDARGLSCPLPLVMTKVAIEEIAVGQSLLLLATDPEAPVDVGAWAADEGHTVGQRSDEPWLVLRITRGRRPAD